MNSQQTREQKRANLRLAVILAVVALLLALWPLYMLHQMKAGG